MTRNSHVDRHSRSDVDHRQADRCIRPRYGDLVARCHALRPAERDGLCVCTSNRGDRDGRQRGIPPRDNMGVANRLRAQAGPSQSAHASGRLGPLRRGFYFERGRALDSDARRATCRDAGRRRSNHTFPTTKSGKGS